MRRRNTMMIALLTSVVLILADSAGAYYMPRIGRFLNRDPISEQGGLNLLEALENAPPNQKDSLGLQVMPNNLQHKPCAEVIQAEPVTIGDLMKAHPGFVEKQFAGFGWDLTSKEGLGKKSVYGCFRIPDAQGGGYRCGYLFGWKFHGCCECGNSIIQHVTKVYKWLKDGKVVGEKTESYVESFASNGEWSLVIDTHGHEGSLQPGDKADQRCTWTRVEFCCGRFDDKAAPQKYEKYEPGAPSKIKCAGPKTELTFNFCYDLTGGSTLDLPEPYLPKPKLPTQSAGGDR
jgi:hypothetical protein